MEQKEIKTYDSFEIYVMFFVLNFDFLSQDSIFQVGYVMFSNVKILCWSLFRHERT